MRLRNSITFAGNSDNTKADVAALPNQIELLSEMFDTVMIIDPVQKKLIDITRFGIRETTNSCKNKCPLANDICGCPCTDVASTKETRIRFTYNETEAHYVMCRAIKIKYHDLVLVMINKLNPKFSFGAVKDTTAIEAITKLSSNLVIDPLTQIFNRKYLTDNISYMIKDSMINKEELNLACIDIDNFKRFNDTYGHEFGDKVLKEVAKQMKLSLQNIDEAYPIRIGGDEFVIVARRIDKNRFKATMNKLCIMVDSSKLPYKNERVGIRISIGISSLIADNIDNYKDLYDKADKQLYDAKLHGKGCVR